MEETPDNSEANDNQPGQPDTLDLVALLRMAKLDPQGVRQIEATPEKYNFCWGRVVEGVAVSVASSLLTAGLIFGFQHFYPMLPF